MFCQVACSPTTFVKPTFLWGEYSLWLRLHKVTARVASDIATRQETVGQRLVTNTHSYACHIVNNLNIQGDQACWMCIYQTWQLLMSAQNYKWAFCSWWQKQSYVLIQFWLSLLKILPGTYYSTWQLLIVLSHFLALFFPHISVTISHNPVQLKWRKFNY